MVPLKDLPEWWEFCEKYRYDPYAFAVECLGMKPTWQQKLLLDSIAFDGSRTSVASGHGCFGIDTPIMMDNGDINAVQNIKVGDRLMGDDGKSSRNVLELKRGRENLYRFTYNDGSSHIFNESHILCLKTKHGEKYTCTVRWWLEQDQELHSNSHCYRNIKNNNEWKEHDLEISLIEPLGEGDYYGFVLDGNSQFLGGDFTVLHNTGKTASAGFTALWHLLCFEQSIMMFTAPQIGQLKKQVWKEISLSLERLRNHDYGWLADYVGFQSEMVYVKGFKENWHIFAKTAPKHQPTNIAGNHGDNYMVWCDEACGIADAVLDVVLGALTHDDNRCVMTSQPASNAGMFYDTHHKLSHINGGVWTALKFNGEQSPIVSVKSIKEQQEKYGSRDDPQYKIRVLGEFPERLDQFLISLRMIDACYDNVPCIDEEGEQSDFGYVITVDVGGGVGRDDSVIAVSKVWGELSYGERARRAEVIDIPLCKNRDDITELLGVINTCILAYPNATLVVDDNGAGKGLGQMLKKNGIFYIPVYWGGACFNNDDRKTYFNKKAQAFVCLQRAIQRGHFKIMTRRFITKIKEQTTKIPYTFDEYSRYKIKSKEEMRREGIKSPDLVDAFAFIFLAIVNYLQAFIGGRNGEQESPEEEEKAQVFNELESALDGIE